MDPKGKELKSVSGCEHHVAQEGPGCSKADTGATDDVDRTSSRITVQEFEPRLIAGMCIMSHQGRGRRENIGGTDWMA